MDLLLLVVALSVLAWVLLSRWLARVSVTAPITLVVAGALTFSVLQQHLPPKGTGDGVRVVAEYALVFVLFGDASRISFAWLREQARLPARLLLVGLPLSILLGILVAAGLFPDAGPWVVAIIGAALAPTDAALGSSVMTDPRVPRQVRRVLNVESGLNDGLATPFVLFFISAALASEERLSVASAVASAAAQLVGGVTLGLVVGAGGAAALRWVSQRGWIDHAVIQLGVFTLPVIAYAGSVELRANGFVAAFVAGIAFGNVARALPSPSLDFVEDSGAVLALVVWFVFGAFVADALPGAAWGPALAYALVSLTVVRMLPVGLALLGSGVARRDRWVVGWLGPRGLASVVFALLALDDLGTEGRLVVQVVGVTVLASVFLHGLTAVPIARTYGRTGGSEAVTEAEPVRRPTPWRRRLNPSP